MHISWMDAELLVAVADAASLSAAAKQLRVTQPTISRRLAELEAALREPLFVRSVRGVTPTRFAEHLLEPARRMAEAARDVALAAAGADTRLRGAVRVTAPPGIAYDLIAPFAVKLRRRLPEIRLEVLSTVSYLDLARREADLGIRFESPGQRAVGHELQVLATLEQGVAAYATREYIATLPRGFGLADIAWVGWAPPLENTPPNPQLAALIPGFAPVFAADDFIVQHRAAEAGIGAIILGRTRSRLALPSPLVQVKLDLGQRVARLQLLCARSSLSIPRVRAVAEALTAEFAATAAPEPRQTRSRKAR